MTGIPFALSTSPKTLCCTHCAASLVTVAPFQHETRQVFDIPAPRVRVTEHRAERKTCPWCGITQQAAFPDHVKAPTQYGESFAAWTSYLNAYQLLPLERIAQLYNGPTCRFIKAVEVREWIKGDILPTFTGTVVHDCHAAYFKEHYRFTHVLCNARLLRECQRIAEHDGQEWAKQMKAYLTETWKLTKASRLADKPLTPEILKELEQRYDAILMAGESEWAKDTLKEKPGPRGRIMRSKAGNLGKRMKEYKASILRFLWDAQIPFDNNQAERDIRMVKVKYKISGCYRTESGAKHFARLITVISTLIKQGKPILSSLAYALRHRTSLVET